MRYLNGDEKEQALEYLLRASKVALNSACERARCGTIIVSTDEIIGTGYNRPPGNKESQRRCKCSKKDYDLKITDKTCCIHAEQMAIIDGLRNNPIKVQGSRLYFCRIDNEGKPTRAGQPYCTICSKMTLEAGIAEFVLWHDAGVCVYGAEEYNDLSYRFTSEDALES